MSALTREQVVVGLDELRTALLDTAVLAKGGMSELVLQEAVAALSSPCACEGRKVLLSAVYPLAIAYANGTFSGLARIELSGEILQGRKHVRVLILAEPQGEGRDEEG